MNAWEITKKDLKLLTRDVRALAVLVILPLVFITIIGLTFGKLMGWQAENQVLKFTIIEEIDYEGISSDPDDGTISVPLDADQKRRNARQLLVDLVDGLQVSKGIRVNLAEPKDRAAVDLAVLKGEVAAGVVVGKEFFQRVDQLKFRDISDQKYGKLAEGLTSLDMEVFQKKGFEGTGAVIDQMMLFATIRTIGSYVACKQQLLKNQIAERCREWEAPYEKGQWAEPQPPEAIEKEGTNRANLVYNRIVPGLTVMFMFFLINIMARSFIHERDLGTLRRLKIAPLGTPALLAGKTLPFLIVSLVQSSLLFGAGKLLFDMSWGSEPWLLAPVVFCTSVAATSLGLLVAAMVRTDSQISAYANIVVISMAGISGCLIPRDLLPYQMQQISLATPHAWAVMAFKEILPDDNAIPNFPAIWQSCGMLLAFGAVFFILGVWRFSKMKS